MELRMITRKRRAFDGILILGLFLLSLIFLIVGLADAESERDQAIFNMQQIQMESRNEIEFLQKEIEEANLKRNAMQVRFLIRERAGLDLFFVLSSHEMMIFRGRGRGNLTMERRLNMTLIQFSILQIRVDRVDKIENAIVSLYMEMKDRTHELGHGAGSAESQV